MSWRFPVGLICPRDFRILEHFPEFESHYKTKHDIARILKPKSILEIGVRTGYSAYAFLAAAPKATYLGVDLGLSAPDQLNWFWWASFILRDFEHVLLIQADSSRLPVIARARFDFIHIDGGHDKSHSIA